MKRALVMAALLVLGCKGEGKAPGSGSGSGSGKGKAAGAKREKREDPRAAVEKEALAFLAEWTEVQKKLDFAAYAALYEPHTFRGVKRTAKGGVKEFDFAGWKIDRGRMFEKKFEIATEPLAVETWLDKGSGLKAGIAVVRFTQHWKSGSYADHGIKVLHLWQEKPGQMRIVYEDLLNSEPGWDRVAENVKVADLAPPADVVHALALWKKLAPTGADYHEKLASIPADPAVSAPMALALIAGGEFTCTDTVEYGECGEDHTNFADFNLKSTFADPCLRRRLALWALPELDPADIRLVADTLIAMLEMPDEPETELQAAALAAFERAPEAIRLRAYKTAMARDMEDKIKIDGLSEDGLISAARDLGIDAAALALDRGRHLEVLADLLNDVQQMSEETRSTILVSLAEVKDIVSTEALKKCAAGSDSCALAMDAALALEERGDGSFIPRRWPRDNEDIARAALCMSMHDTDEGRARTLLASFVGPEGVLVTEVHKSEWEHLEDPDAGPDDQPEPDAGPERVTSLDDIEELVRQTIEFENLSPEWEKRELSFTAAKDGGLRLESFYHYTFNGCGC
jgi:hypothetical protein